MTHVIHGVLSLLGGGGPPSISIAGTVEIGETLTATHDGDTVQWYRDGVAISGETADTYVVAREDIGPGTDAGTEGITCRATNGGGTTTSNELVFAHATYFPDASIWVAHNDAVVLNTGAVEEWEALYGGGGVLGLITLTQVTAGERPAWEASGGEGGRPRIVFDGVDDILDATLTLGDTWPSIAMGFVGTLLTPSDSGDRLIQFATGALGITQSVTANLLRATVAGLSANDFITQETGLGLWSMDWDTTNGSRAFYNALLERSVAGVITERPDIRPFGLGGDSDSTDCSHMEARFAYLSETRLTADQMTHMAAFAEYHTGVDCSLPALLDVSTEGAFTRASEASAVDPRNGWEWYDLITLWPASNVRRVIPADDALLMEKTRTNYWQNTNTPASVIGILGSQTTVTGSLADPIGGTAGAEVDFQGATNGANEAINATPDITGDVRAVLSCYAKNNLDLRFLYRNAANTVLRSADVAVGATWARVEAMVADYDNRMGFNADAAQTTGIRHIFHPQVELGVEPTSPIRTTGTAATRAQERLVIASANVRPAIRTGKWRVDIWPSFSGDEYLLDNATPNYIAHFIPSNTWILAIRGLGGGWGISVFSSAGWVNLTTSVLVAGWDRHEKISIVIDQANLLGEVFFSDVSQGSAVSYTANASAGTDVHIGTSSTGGSPFNGVIGDIVEVA